MSDYFVLAPSGQGAGNPDDSGARDYGNNAFALGASYAFNERWRLSASSGSAAETPTLTEMAYSADSSGMNTQLDTAKNLQQQLSLDFQAQQAQVRLTLFAIRTRDELLVAQSINGRSIYTNAAQTRRQGAELWGRWALNPYWQIQASATALSAEFASGALAGNGLPGVAEREAQVQISYLPLASDRLRLLLASQTRGQVAADDANQLSAPGFTRWDLALEGDLALLSGQGRWWLKLNNLLNEQYVGSVVVNQSNGRAFEPGSGRALQLGMQLNW